MVPELLKCIFFALICTRMRLHDFQLAKFHEVSFWQKIMLIQVSPTAGPAGLVEPWFENWCCFSFSFVLNSAPQKPHCTMCTLVSIFTSQPNKLRPTVKVVFFRCASISGRGLRNSLTHSLINGFSNHLICLFYLV